MAKTTTSMVSKSDVDSHYELTKNKVVRKAKPLAGIKDQDAISQRIAKKFPRTLEHLAK